MDEHLEAILKQVKLRVQVMDGENPLLNTDDALRIAVRNQLLYRYAQNGDYYQLRWSEDLPPVSIHKSMVCATLCGRIIETIYPPDEEISIEVESAKEEKPKKTRSKKAAKQS
jgi:hypothetical protein